MSAIHSEDDLANNFKNIFDSCIKEFGVYPSRRYFQAVSKIDEKSYRKRLNKSWTDICELYGYKPTRENNRAEQIVLQMIAKIMDCSYVPQYSPAWLIGAGGYRLRCDGYYEKLNLVVEFDGLQHRQPVEAYGGEKTFVRQQENDNIKNVMLAAHGIKLLRIAGNEPWHSEEYLRGRLKDVV